MGLDRYEVGSTTNVSFVERLRETRRIAQPPDPNITDRPYRAISIFPSLVLARTGVTPNQITLLWIVLGLAAVIGLGSPDNRIQIIGALLLQLSYLFDFVDGELARLQNRLSKRGVFFDLAGHGLIKTGLFLALGFALFTSTGRTEYLLLGFCACVSLSGAYALPFYAASASVNKRPLSTGETQVNVGNTKRLFALTGYLFESSGLYALTLLAALLNKFTWLIIFYGLVGPVSFIYRILRYRGE